MSSTSHLTVTQTSEAKINKGHSSFNLGKTPCDGLSHSFHSLSPTNFNYLNCVKDESSRKQSSITTYTLIPTPPTKLSSINIRRNLSAISLPIPWHRRTRLPSDDKTSTDSISKHSQQHKTSHNSRKVSQDHLLTLRRLFSSSTHTSEISNDDEQTSPITELTTLNESIRWNGKMIKTTKEHGHLRSSPRLMSRWEKTMSKDRLLHYVQIFLIFYRSFPFSSDKVDLNISCTFSRLVCMKTAHC